MVGKPVRNSVCHPLSATLDARITACMMQSPRVGVRPPHAGRSCGNTTAHRMGEDSKLIDSTAGFDETEKLRRAPVARDTGPSLTSRSPVAHATGERVGNGPTPLPTLARANQTVRTGMVP